MTSADGGVETYWDMVKDPDCAVRVWNVSHAYGRHRALNSVNLTVRRGDLLGLIGPNGAGKTTLLKILATLLVPSKGQVYVMHHSVRKRPHYVRLNIGYMPDSTGIHEDLTVHDYLRFYSALYRVEEETRERSIKDALDVVGLYGRRGSRIQDLSLGMQQRLSVARLLIHDPRVLLLDEPAAGLDPSARIELWNLLDRLASLGKTVLVSSHVLGDIGRLCNKVAILEKGDIVFQGHLNDLISAASPVRKFRAVFRGRRAEDIAELVRRFFPHAAVETGGETLWIGLGGAPDEPADLFNLLVREGWTPTRFGEEQVDLEGAFLQLTRGDVA